MSVASNVVKVTAKTALKGKYINVAVSSFILIFSWFITQNIAGLLSLVVGDIVAEIIFALFAVLLVFPVFLGVLRYIWRLLLGACDKPLATFYWFSSKEIYLRSIRFILQFVIRFVFWLAILNVPSALLYVLSHGAVFEFLDTAMPVWAGNLGFFSVFLRNISFVVVFIIMLKFYMAPLLFVADDNIDANEAMYNSSVISRKTAWDFVGLLVSLFGWILLSLLVLPLPFTLPVILTSYAVHSRFSVADYNRHIEQSQVNENEFFQ